MTTRFSTATSSGVVRRGRHRAGLNLSAMLKVAGAATALFAATQASAVNVSLGASSQLLTLYGLGPAMSDPALGTFKVGQGSSSFDGTTSTFTLSGAIAGGDPGYNSGTYSFVTTYAGAAGPTAGPNAPRAISNAANPLFFNYSFIDPSTTITLFLNTPGNAYEIPLFANDNFVAGTSFGFLFTSAACTGVLLCTQNGVGLTPGATIFGTSTISVSFPDNVTPLPGVPEPAAWAMMVAGFGLAGGAMRRRKALATVVA